MIGRRNRLRDTALGYAFLVPALLVFAAFAYYPLYRLVYLSTHERRSNVFRGNGGDEFLGWGNIGDVLTGEDFRAGLMVSVKFMLYTVPAGLILGVLLAVAADRRLRGIRIYQTIFSSTVASSVAVSAVIFLTLLQPAVGLLRNIGFLDIRDPEGAVRAVSLASVWQNAGLTFVIVMAALQTVPEELKEAALLDGFGPVRRFFRLTVPLISPALLFLAVVLVVHALQVFAQFEIIQTTSEAFPLLYRIADPQQTRPLSTRAALSLGLFGITLVVSVLQLTILERRVHYGD